MSVTMSKPPKPLKIKRTQPIPQGVQWRDAETRREAKRKIAAIRREAELEHRKLAYDTLRLDARVLRSPKVLGGVLLLLLLLGGMMSVARVKPRKTVVETVPLEQIRVRRSLRAVAEALTLFRVHTKTWPSQRLGLFALAKDYDYPGWKGPYINWAYKDPWGTPYVYTMPVSPFDAPELFSCGPDTKPHTEDDIVMYPEDFVCKEGSWKRSPEEEANSEDL